MASSGVLVSRQSLWGETWKRVDRFLPDLRNDLAMEGINESKEAVAASVEGTEKPSAGERRLSGEPAPVDEAKGNQKA